MRSFELLGYGLAGMAVVMLTISFILKTLASGRFFRRQSDFHHGGSNSIPRFGGLALALAFIAIQTIIALVHPDTTEQTKDQLIIFFSSLAMFALGFWDDLKPLGAKKKLL